MGQRVVIVRSNIAQMIGLVMTVLGDLEPFEIGEKSTWYGVIPSGTLMHALEKPFIQDGIQFICCYPSSHLEPYEPDDREAGEWTSQLRELCSCPRVSDKESA